MQQGCHTQRIKPHPQSSGFPHRDLLPTPLARHKVSSVVAGRHSWARGWVPGPLDTGRGQAGTHRELQRERERKRDPLVDRRLPDTATGMTKNVPGTSSVTSLCFCPLPSFDGICPAVQVKLPSPEQCQEGPRGPELGSSAEGLGPGGPSMGRAPD